MDRQLLGHKKLAYIPHTFCVLLRRRYSALDGVFSTHLLSSSDLTAFKADVALMIFCLDDLFIDISGVSESPSITVLLFLFLYLLCIFRCRYVGCINIYRCYIFLLD